MHLEGWQWVLGALGAFLVGLSKTGIVGLINPSSLRIDLPLAPFAMMGALFGRAIIQHIDQALFEKLALILTLATGIRMLF